MVLISEELLIKAWSRDFLAKENGRKYIGVDVARMGNNLTVFTELIEGEDRTAVMTRIKRLKGRDLMSVVGNLLAFINFDWQEHGGASIVCCIDATGIGSGVFDRLRELQNTGKLSYKIRLVEVHNGAGITTIFKNPLKPTEHEKNANKAYFNVGAYAYDFLAESLKNDLRIKPEKCFVDQFSKRRFDYRSNGKLFIESKQAFTRRLDIDSPDEADSLVLANFARKFADYSDYVRHSLGTM